MFALCLRVDDYATDTTLVAADLAMPATKVNQLFKTLGCSMSKLTQKDLTLLGLPDNAGETKRAVLKCPIRFPKPRMRKKTR
jgi:DNA-directed RNA polymerase I subunit RPA49